MRSALHTLFLLLACCVGMQHNAQEISFTAKVDKQAVVTGEQFQLTITVVNANGRVSPPDLDGLTIVRPAPWRVWVSQKLTALARWVAP